MSSKKYKEILLSTTLNFIFNAIIFFLPVIWAGIQHFFTKKSFIEILIAIPWYIYLLSTSISFIVFIRLKMNEGKTNTLNFDDIYPHEELCQFPEYGMCWKIEVPKNEKNWTMEHIRVNPNPTCPKCKVLMTHQDNFFWYTFSCFKCGQKIRTLMSIEKIRFQIKELFKIKFKNNFKN